MGVGIDSDKTAAAAAPSRRAPPPIPPRKRDSQLSIIVRKDSEQRLVQTKENSNEDQGSSLREKQPPKDQDSSPEEKRPPPKEASKSPASSPGSSTGSDKTEKTGKPVKNPEKPEPAAEGKDVEAAPVRHVSNGDDVRGEGHVQRPHDVRLPEIPNGSAPSTSSVEKPEVVEAASEVIEATSEIIEATSEVISRSSEAPSSECSGAKPEDRERDRQGEEGRPDRKGVDQQPKSEPRPRGGQAEEDIGRDSESDSEEVKPLLKERGEGTKGRTGPGFGEGTKSAPFGSEGESIPLLSSSEEKETSIDRCADGGESSKSNLGDVKLSQEIPSVEQKKSSEAVLGSNKTSEVVEEESLEEKKRLERKEQRTFISEKSEAKTTPTRPEQAPTPSPPPPQPTPLGMELSICLLNSWSVPGKRDKFDS